MTFIQHYVAITSVRLTTVFSQAITRSTCQQMPGNPVFLPTEAAYRIQVYKTSYCDEEDADVVHNMQVAACVQARETMLD